MKRHRVTILDGKGGIVKTIGNKIKVTLDKGEVKTYPSDDISKDSSAG